MVPRGSALLRCTPQCIIQVPALFLPVLFLPTSLVVATLAIPAFGQVIVSDQGEIELTRKAIQTKRQEIVTTAMDLSDEEGQAFWPLYRDWRANMAGLGDRKVMLIEELEDKWGELTDERAGSMLDEWFQIRTGELKLHKQYVKRFRKILPEAKVARFFQLENKMDAAVNYNLAGAVLLVE